MKKILCLVMAAVLAVVMMAPMEARAASELDLIVNGGTPVIVGYAPGQAEDDNNLGVASGAQLSYHITVPVICQIEGLTSPEYLSGRFAFMAKSSFIVYPHDSSGQYTVSLTKAYTEVDGLRCVASTWSGGFATGNIAADQLNVLNVLNDPVFLYFDKSIYSFGRVPYEVIVYLEYDLTLDTARDLDDSYISLLAWETFVSVAEESGIYSSAFPPDQSWISGLFTALGDRIVSAITGAGGGESISSAQDKLDQQLNDFEAAENQIADQVVDRVEIPSLTLNDSQASALTWVIGTINDWYIKFDELQVIFGSIMFFGIIGVVLFGRRSL